jgi:PRTRC genetic system ThiF family protein
LVADGLCRLLIKKPDIPIFIIDYDRVAKKNLLRQNFYPQDIGKFKAQVIAERYARIYGRKIAFSINPFKPDMISQYWGNNMGEALVGNALIIGCVDNHTGRIAMNAAISHSLSWWLDTGNGYNSGQVLIGNVPQAELMRESFDGKTYLLKRAPAPSLQAPSLLQPPTKTIKRDDCAEAIEDNRQSQVINQAMAVLILEFVRRILARELTWLGAYLDMDAGTMKPVPAEPDIVSRMLAIDQKELMDLKSQV